MTELPEECYFPQCTSSINVVLERILNFLNGHLVLTLLRGANHAICALTNGLDRLQVVSFMCKQCSYGLMKRQPGLPRRAEATMKRLRSAFLP